MVVGLGWVMVYTAYLTVVWTDPFLLCAPSAYLGSSSPFKDSPCCVLSVMENLVKCMWALKAQGCL